MELAYTFGLSPNAARIEGSIPSTFTSSKEFTDLDMSLNYLVGRHGLRLNYYVRYIACG